MRKECEDFKLLGNFQAPAEPVCEECIKTNAHWVHLRTCQTCGQTLCCDSSPNTHMTMHHKSTNHPVVISAEPGERWIFCYVHNTIKEY